MSRIKGLKGDPNNYINLYDLFSVFSLDKKSKYTELLIRIIKKTKALKNYSEEIKKELYNDYKIETGELNDFSVIVLGLMVEHLFDKNDLKNFMKFCEYNEKRLIKNNDLQSYDDFSKIYSEVAMAEIHMENAELEKQTKIIHKDDEWIILRPLTFQASKKYGNNTKWCTTMEKYPVHFKDYSERGILIYCINKKTNYRVAVFYSLKGTKEFSFWDELDERIDSMETELPHEILKLVMDEVKDKKAVSNDSLYKSRPINLNIGEDKPQLQDLRRSDLVISDYDNSMSNDNHAVTPISNTDSNTLLISNLSRPITYLNNEEDNDS